MRECGPRPRGVNGAAAQRREGPSDGDVRAVMSRLIKHLLAEYAAEAFDRNGTVLLADGETGVKVGRDAFSNVFGPNSHLRHATTGSIDYVCRGKLQYKSPRFMSR